MVDFLAEEVSVFGCHWLAHADECCRGMAGPAFGRTLARAMRDVGSAPDQMAARTDVRAFMNAYRTGTVLENSGTDLGIVTGNSRQDRAAG